MTACLLCAHSLVAQAPGAARTGSGSPGAKTGNTSAFAGSGYYVVTVDLNAKAFQQILPFDVPFIISGSLPSADVQRVLVCHREVSESLVEDYIRGDYQRAATELDEPGWTDAQPFVWERFGASRALAEGADPSAPAATDLAFNVFVPPLDAEKYYRFRFAFDAPLAQARLTAFREETAKLLDREIRDVQSADGDPTFGDTTREKYRELHGEIGRLLRGISGRGELVGGALANRTPSGLSCAWAADQPSARDRDTLRVPTDTVLDPDLPDSLMEVRFRELVASILEPQLNRQVTLEEHAKRLPAARDALATVLGNDGFEAVVAEHRRLAQGDSLRRELLDMHRDALSLLDADADRLREVVRGCGGAACDSIQGITDPSALDSYLANYNQLGTNLAWLSGLTLADSGVDPAQALDDAQQQSLANFQAQMSDADAFVQLLGLDVRGLKDELTRRQNAITTAAAEVELVARNAVMVYGSTTGNFGTFSKYYVSMDFGVMYAPTIDQIVPYLGANFYFRPVNKDAPLSQKGSFGRRFAVTVGLTLSHIGETDGSAQAVAEDIRLPLFGDSYSLMVGGGLRVTQSIRIGGGALVFRQRDPNPLIDEISVGVTPYLGLSVDLDVASFLKGLFGTGEGIIK